MRSGYIVIASSNNTLFLLSMYGHNWSRVTDAWGTVIYPGTDSRAGLLHFNTATGASVYTSTTAQHLNGYPLRCLSTAVEGEERW